MIHTILAMLMSSIFAYQLGLYYGAKWSTNNFENYRKKLDKKHRKRYNK